jgi:hypothetical protein
VVPVERDLVHSGRRNGSRVVLQRVEHFSLGIGPTDRVDKV